MTNYLPTRADALKAGDVVRGIYGDGDVELTQNAQPAYRGSVELFYRAWYETVGPVSGRCTVGRFDLLDKRITDEEYEALSAPGVKDECIGN